VDLEGAADLLWCGPDAARVSELCSHLGFGRLAQRIDSELAWISGGTRLF
jgi:hypothetical protein